MNSEQIAQMTSDEIGRAILNGELSSDQLSREQYIEWMTWEPPPVDLKSFHLGSEAHRQLFLYQYQWQGDEVLFTAVAHIWDSLEGERGAHCILIGLLSGTGGKGKNALRKTLQKFLAECLDGPDMIPRADDFDCLEEWNAAVHCQWDREEARIRALCARYSAILDGRDPDALNSDINPRSSGLILGPWL